MLNEKQFLALLTAFGVTTSNGEIRSGGDMGQIDRNTLRLVVLAEFIRDNENWTYFIEQFSKDLDLKRLHNFKQRNYHTFETRVNTRIRQWYRDSTPSSEQLMGHGDYTILGGEVDLISGEVVNTGIHCYDGETVMCMAESGDETALHWLDMCDYVCYRRGTR